MNQFIAVTSSTDKIIEAQKIATQLGVPILSNRNCIKDFDFILHVDQTIGIYKTIDKNPQIFSINFNTPQYEYRRQTASLRKEMLARAIGFKPIEAPSIIDATAGLGRDSFLLASLGFKVTMLEQSPYLTILLADGLSRASHISALEPIIKRMHLIQADANIWLKNHPKVDVIYMDPMFPPRKKKAAVKKDMAWLQNFIGENDLSDRLFATALACALHRVVVKRPRLAGYLAKRPPNFSLTGRSSRFDVYLV